MGKSFDLSPQAQVLEGLQRPRKQIPCSLLYDTRGSELYEQITELEEYYPFRVEEARLKEHARDIASQIPENSVIVELGCGTARKSGIVLSAVQALHARCRFVGIDVSASFLQEARSNLVKQGMANDCIEMVEGEYMAGLQKVRAMYPSANLCIMFLGSSVGNFTDEGAVQFFLDIFAAVGTRCQIFLCADMWKDVAKLYAAYHDKKGVTELFIKNGMRCALGLLGHTTTQAEEKSWEYEVVVNKELRRVEMWLRFTNELLLPDHNIQIASGERILVEVSRKFTAGDFNRLANDAGFHIDVAWRDSMWGMQMLIPFREALQRCWAQSDGFFRSVPDWCAKPIDVRHPFKFYYGHIQAFAKLKLLPNDPPSPTDIMFSRGIDPNVVDPTKCHAHPEVPHEWPSRGEIERYVTQTRTKITTALAKNELSARCLVLALEHEYMHLETLAYMRAQERKAAFEKGKLSSQTKSFSATLKSQKSYKNGRVHHVNEEDEDSKMVYIAPGKVTIGGDVSDGNFMWDNESPAHSITVREPFKVSCKPVTVSEFLTFIKAGGYSQPQYWNEQDFAYFQRQKITKPATWSVVQSEYWIHTPSASHHWTQVANEPVFASLSEAEAYCKWSGGRVMTEEEYHLILASKDGANKVHQLRSGGWEWTSSLFLPFDGFVKMAEYPEYSSDFFDGSHYVLKGASPVTHRCMQRDTFRNFYQRQYPYVFAKFRVCKNVVNSEN
ncbi:hypothetical protein KC19_3G171100 [Ceratodon purpureus]|uniref:Uncharacterized protein n=1 Tax=Ceratodon purpureus TaxID=3225 RepID=A0A8T0IKZ3_CERPU|nr:hypothetical protein KC19_3G171100 [Ceratodon purpureus]